MGTFFNIQITIFYSIPFDVILGTAFLLVLATAIILGIFSVSRRIYQTIAKITDLISDIRTTPLVDKLLHVDFLVNDSGNLQKMFLKWWTIFEITYENRLKNISNTFFEFIDDGKKKIRPTRANLNKLLEIYNELNNNVYLIALLLIDDINNSLEPERIYRDFFVKMNNIFLMLNREIIELEMLNMIDPENKTGEIIDSISEAFSDFYDILNKGGWNQLQGLADKLGNFISHLIYLIDIVPRLKVENDMQLGRKMTELKNKYVTFGSPNDDLSSRAEKFRELEKNVDTLRIKLNNQIRRLQYIKGSETLKEIYSLMSDYERFASFEENVQQKLSDISEEISEIITRTSKSTNLLYRKAKDLHDIRNNQGWSIYAFQDEVNKISNLSDRWVIIAGKFGIRQQRGIINFEEILQETILLLGDFIKCSQKIAEFEKEINTISIQKGALLSEAIITDSILSQIDVKISQYHSVKALKAFLPELENIQLRLNRDIKNEFKNATDDQHLRDLKDLLNTTNADAMSLSEKITAEIFYDYITQELIIYLGRYPDDNDEYENFINYCIQAKAEGKYLEVINSVANVIPKLKMKG